MFLSLLLIPQVMGLVAREDAPVPPETSFAEVGAAQMQQVLNDVMDAVSAQLEDEVSELQEVVREKLEEEVDDPAVREELEEAVRAKLEEEVRELEEKVQARLEEEVSAPEAKQEIAEALRAQTAAVDEHASFAEVEPIRLLPLLLPVFYPEDAQAFQVPSSMGRRAAVQKAATAVGGAAAALAGAQGAQAKSVLGVNGALDFGPLAGDQPGGEGTGKALGINDDSLGFVLGGVTLAVGGAFAQWQGYQDDDEDFFDTYESRRTDRDNSNRNRV